MDPHDAHDFWLRICSIYSMWVSSWSRQTFFRHVTIYLDFCVHMYLWSSSGVLSAELRQERRNLHKAPHSHTVGRTLLQNIVQEVGDVICSWSQTFCPTAPLQRVDVAKHGFLGWMAWKKGSYQSCQSSVSHHREEELRFTVVHSALSPHVNAS